MPFDFGDVVLVRFPFTDQTALKQRPAVIVSSATYNIQKPDVVVAAITSQVLGSGFAEFQVSEWAAAGLIKPSAVKPVFATLETSVLVRKLGTLGSTDQKSLRGMLAIALGQ